MSTKQQIICCNKCTAQQVMYGDRLKACPFCNSRDVWYDTEDIPESGDTHRKRMGTRGFDDE